MRRAIGSILVHTFKEGVLARAAHDLRFGFRDFSVTLDGEALAADFDLGRLEVQGAIEQGALKPYGASERAAVERAMRREVLDVERFPVARFRGVGKAHPDGYVVDGELELRGKKAPLAFRVESRAGRHRASFELSPSRWGIAPYRAMLGAIRVQDRVRVELDLTEGEHESD